MSDDFRSLASIGLSRYSINKNGILFDHKQNRIKSFRLVGGEYPKYQLEQDDGRVVWFRLEYLVGEAFWRDTEIDGTFKDRILLTKEFYFLKPNEKKTLIVDGVPDFGYIITIYGDIWNVDTKEKLSRFESRGRIFVKVKKKIKMLKTWMADAFLPDKGDTDAVIHIDGNEDNNHISNIKRVKSSEVNLRRRKKKSYVSQFALTDYLCDIVRKHYGEEMVQHLLSLEQEGLDFVIR